MLLLAIANLDPRQVSLFAASVPRGGVFEKLREAPNVVLLPLELGGAEVPRPGQDGRVRRAVEAAAGVARLVQYVRSAKIDVILSIDRTVSAHIAQVVSRVTRRPFILSAQYPYYVSSGLAYKLVVEQARKIIAPTDFLIEHYARAGVESGKMVKVPCALQIEHYDATLPADLARQELDVDAADAVVVMAGRLSPFKGQDDLIKAASLLLQQRPNTYFLIAGRDTDEGVLTHGPQATSFKAILEKMIGEYGVGHRVRLVGYVRHLPSLYAASNVVAMPSWEEPFGLVALEAMAMARPVVATRAGGVPEFAPDGEVGRLVPPRDPQGLATALLDLIDDPQRAQAMGQQGRQRVEAFHTAQGYAAGVTAAIYHALDRPAPQGDGSVQHR